MAQALSYVANALGFPADVSMSPAPPVSAAVAAVNGGYKVPGNGGKDNNNDEDDGKEMYDQFRRMVIQPTKVATLKETAADAMGASHNQCCRDFRNTALSNWLLLTEGIEIQNGYVFMIAQEGVFYTTVRAQAADYLGYMLKFKNYLSRYRHSEYQALLDCRRARQRFWGRMETYATPLSNIKSMETLRICIDPEQDTAFGPVVASDSKHVSGALDTRSKSALVAARAKQKEMIKARAEELRRSYAAGESVGQLVRAGGNNLSVVAQPSAEKTLARAQASQLTDAFALMQLGSETGKAAAQAGDKGEGKVARNMQREGAAQVRAVAAGWAGTMTYVNVKTAVAKNVGLIWILDGQCDRTVSRPVYVVADSDNKNWYIVKLDTFNQMRSIGRKTTARYEATRMVKIEGAGDLPIEVVPLMPSTIYVAAGNSGRESDNLADAYSAQLDVIKFEHGRNTVAAASQPFVPRGS